MGPVHRALTRHYRLTNSPMTGVATVLRVVVQQNPYIPTY